MVTDVIYIVFFLKNFFEIFVCVAGGTTFCFTAIINKVV